MNFLGKSSSSSGQSFYGEEEPQQNNQISRQNLHSSFMSRGMVPFSSSSAASSSSFHHNRGRWFDNPQNSSANNGDGEEDDNPPAAAAAGAHEDVDDDGVRRGDSSSSPDHVLGLGGGGGAVVVVEKEHMFDKVVTPSDVGKLNRLVIPKQHAEKYFPLDSSTNEKGLLLNFEDRNGKPWRFRYSYWNSSQSYVMTKGWSRFVKEKKLDAGDIVSFQRGVGEQVKDRLFIDWRRRLHPADHHPPPPLRGFPPPQAAASFPRAFSHLIPPPHQQNYLSFQYPWNPLVLQSTAAARDQYSQLLHPNNATNYHQFHPYSYGGGGGGPVLPPHPHHGFGSVSPGDASNPRSSPLIYLRSAAAPQQDAGLMVQLQGGGRGGGGSGDGGMEPMIFESVPVVHGKAAAKRLRLFGVNMDCPVSESDVEGATMVAPSSSASHMNPPLNLRLYNGGSPLPALQPLSANLHNKANASKSFDLDI